VFQCRGTGALIADKSRPAATASQPQRKNETPLLRRPPVYRAPAGSDHEALPLGEAELLTRNSERAEIARTKHTGSLGEFRDLGYRFSDGHYLIFHNVGDYSQVPTLKSGEVAKLTRHAR